MRTCSIKQQRSQLFANGGGGGARPPNVPTEKNNVYVTYMRERAKRASASEIYVFAGFEIHLHTLYNQYSGMPL